MNRSRIVNRLSLALALTVCVVSLGAVLAVFAEGPSMENASQAAPWVLTEQQRAAFLQYYAPIIFKRAEKSDGAAGVGQDWITNFNFDNDGWNLANNARVWRDELSAFVGGGEHGDWQIRPTLYTAAIELMQNGQKSLVLLYHVYHARQEGNIHDWERLEIRVDGVVGDPGSGEKINYVVITEHTRHKGKRYPDDALNFYTTRNGMHIMLWQAQWAETGNVYRGELHWVEDSWEEIAALNNDSKAQDALLDIDRSSIEASFDYVFVPELDDAAVDYWNTQTITGCNASDLVVDWKTPVVKVDQTKRIKYELQDVADLFFTHWDDGTENVSWEEPLIPILLESPIVDETGAVQVSAGLQYFYCVARNDLHGDVKHGYPRKHWFWGVYRFNRDDHFYDAAYDKGDPSKMRAVTNQFPDCLGNFWWQHDYFVHNGEVGSWSLSDERGEWLPRGWNTPEQGGFDGRWQQIFPDDRELDCQEQK